MKKLLLIRFPSTLFLTLPSSPKAAEEAVVAQAAAAEDKVVDLAVFSSFD